MHISAVPLVYQDVLFFGAMDLRTVSLSPSYRGPIHLQETHKNSWLLEIHVILRHHFYGLFNKPTTFSIVHILIE